MWTRTATPEDAEAVARDIADGFASYLAWAPPGWRPVVPGPEEIASLRAGLADEGGWCLLALEGDQVVGHVALASVTREDPDPAPPGVTNLSQLFVREDWRGAGVAPLLMAAAFAEAGARGFAQLRLWTPRGAARARRFYEREGWTATGAVHEGSPSGLVTVQYERALR